MYTNETHDAPDDGAEPDDTGAQLGFAAFQPSEDEANEIIENAHMIGSYLMGRVTTLAMDEDGFPNSAASGVVLAQVDVHGNAMSCVYPLHLFRKFVDDCNDIIARYDAEGGDSNG